MTALPTLTILIVYYSRFGAVGALAGHIAEGVRRVEGAEANLLAVEDRPVVERHRDESAHAMVLRRAALINRLAEADALIVGSPSYFGTMASPLKRFFEDLVTAPVPPASDASRPWLHHLFRDKVGAAFVASATPHGGNEQTLHSILTMLMHLGLIVVTPGQREPILENAAAPYGATTITGPKGTPALTLADEEAARSLGERVTLLTTWLRLGRDRWAELPLRKEKMDAPPRGNPPADR